MRIFLTPLRLNACKSAHTGWSQAGGRGDGNTSRGGGGYAGQARVSPLPRLVFVVRRDSHQVEQIRNHFVFDVLIQVRGRA